MPVCLVNAALTSSSAFFIEAAAKTVTVFSCAAAVNGQPITPAKAAATRANTGNVRRVNIWRSVNASDGTRVATLRSGMIECREATNPEAPFRGEGALTARRGSRSAS